MVFFLEQTTSSVMLVVNKAVLRVLYAYFKGVSVQDMPFLAVPGHMHGKGGSCEAPQQVIELNRTHSGFATQFIPLD